MVCYFKTTQLLEKNTDDLTLSELSTWTGVEWAALKTESGVTWLKTDGDWGEVNIPLDRRFVEVRHTHPVGSSIEASRKDFEAFRELVEVENAEIKRFRIIMGRNHHDYTLDELKAKFDK